MAKRKAFSNDQLERVWKATKAFEQAAQSKLDEFIPSVQTPTYFRNDSAQTVPPYGLIQVSGAIELVANGQNFVSVIRPVTTGANQGIYLINGTAEVLTNEFGTAQSGPVFRLLHDGTAYVSGDRLSVKTATFTATYGGYFSVIGPDDIASNIVRVMCDTSVLRGRTKSGGITVGTPANVLAYDATGTITTKEYLAETPLTNLAGTVEIILMPMNGRLLALGIC